MKPYWSVRTDVNSHLSRWKFMQAMGLQRRPLPAMARHDARAAEPDPAVDARALALHKSTGVFEGYTKPALKFTAQRSELPGNLIEPNVSINTSAWSGHVAAAEDTCGWPT